MYTFQIEIPVLECEVKQCWEVRANSEEQAIKLYLRGEGDLIDEEVDVLTVGAPKIIGKELNAPETVY
jgi:hypothetical protein